MDSLEEWLIRYKDERTPQQIYKRAQQAILIDKHTRKLRATRAGSSLFLFGFTVYATHQFIMPNMRGVVQQARELSKREWPSLGDVVEYIRINRK